MKHRRAQAAAVADAAVVVAAVSREAVAAVEEAAARFAVAAVEEGFAAVAAALFSAVAVAVVASAASARQLSAAHPLSAAPGPPFADPRCEARHSALRPPFAAHASRVADASHGVHASPAAAGSIVDARVIATATDSIGRGSDIIRTVAAIASAACSRVTDTWFVA